jgi:phosphoesterase RecJ-like protein
MKENEILILNIKDEIEKASKIALFTHTSCDCDGIGSMCALYQYLQEHNKNASMFCDSDLPEKYKFLKYSDKINVDELNNSFDLAISLDTANSKRLGKYEDYFLSKSNINIDHHISNNGYAKFNYLQQYSSCGEVLYEILKEISSSKINDEIATSLFAAISSDTNQFMNSNVTSRTYSYAGELIDLGADSEKANTWLNKYKTYDQLKLAGFMATNLKYKNGVSYILITLKDLKNLKVKSSDVSSFISLICNVGDSKITLVFKERDKTNFRINLRSIENYDVNKIASLFNGGGHKNAAGCDVQGKYKDALKRVLKECYTEIESKNR